ncbi:hypothetical protein [Flavobacterium sp. GCM10023249]|uniref:hypothetical protein n=1 Tax=unclassified Flavobacterium TaxID=196869 RepID=UPI0036206C8D
MKKHLFFILLLLFSLGITSCQSQKIPENNIKLFQFEDLNNGSVRLRKYVASVSVHKEVEKENPYTIVIFKKIKQYTVTINSIPNEVVFEFGQREKIFITQNQSNVKEMILTDMNKEEFMSKLFELKISNMKLEDEFKKFKENRFYGIRIYKEYVILYTNVTQKNRNKFNASLASFTLLSDQSSE